MAPSLFRYSSFGRLEGVERDMAKKAQRPAATGKRTNSRQHKDVPANPRASRPAHADGRYGTPHAHAPAARRAPKPAHRAQTPSPAQALPLFHVVGIGASAGGLESVGAVLASLTADVGVAVVV